MVAAILTIGNELVSGDVTDSNAAFLARRLQGLGVPVVLIASVPDEEARIVDVIRRERARVDHLIVTGGLGGTPDDITREAVAAAFEVGQEVVAELARDLRERFAGAPEYAARWAALPAGAEPLSNPLGGAPGFRVENVWVLPGLPGEAETMFDRYAERFRSGAPIAVERRRLATRESTIASALEVAATRWPAVAVGSYPSFEASGPQVEIVLKSDDAGALAAAKRWLWGQLDRLA